jgi:hypothetical protein
MITPTPGGLYFNGQHCRYVEGDVYNVVARMKQIDPNLYVVLHEGHTYPWVVMEHCRDGEVRMVKRYAELSPAILDDLRYMLAVPFQERIDIMQREADAHNDAAKRHRESDAWQHFLWDFKTTAFECGLSTDRRYVSRPNKGDRRKRGGA